MADAEITQQETGEPVSRAQPLLMLDFGDRAEFDDPHRERRRL